MRKHRRHQEHIPFLREIFDPIEYKIRFALLDIGKDMIKIDPLSGESGGLHNLDYSHMW
ncbi:hypothetical protein D3C78_1626710 [compost metagenome]